MKLFGPKKEYVFHTNLSVDECIQILRALPSKDLPSLTFMSPDIWKTVAVDVRGQRISIYDLSFTNNAFRPAFNGSLNKENVGSRITGQFTLRAMGKIFIVVVFLMVLNAILFVCFSFSNKSLFVFFLFAIMVVALIHAWNAERKRIIEFIQTVLDATPVTS